MASSKIKDITIDLGGKLVAVYYNDNYFCVRPVIVISKSLIS